MCHRKQVLDNSLCIKCGENLAKAKKAQKVKYHRTFYLAGKKKTQLVGFSLRDAEVAEGKARAQKYENPRGLEKVQEDTITFKELSDWYLNLEWVKAQNYYPTLKYKLQNFNAEFGGVQVGQLKAGDLRNFQAKRKRQGKADSTIDQDIGAAKTMVYRAFDDELVSANALTAFRKVKKLLSGSRKNSNSRGVLSKDEYTALLDHCAPHLKPMVATGYYTGMREGEILSLTWDKVDMKAREIHLEAEDTKDKEPRNVPIMDELFEVLKKVPRAVHDNHVFLYGGKPIKTFRTALQNACERAGIPYGRKVKGGFTFHDLRHTFNTNMRKAGVPESVIMEITGHSTREMFDRYNTIDGEDTRLAVSQLGNFLKSRDHLVTTATN
jgi:integrase